MKFSIVIPSMNQVAFLPETLESILAQSGDFEIEVTIVDGGSTDGTVAFLEGVLDRRVTWSSGPDGGQSNAINRGLSRATGDVVAWLNADDLYRPGALAAVARALRSHPETQWIVGGCEIVDADGTPIRRGVTRYKERRLRHYSLEALKRENFISQMSVFWRRSFGEQVGPLDESLYFTMDYDLWLRMAKICDPLVLDTIVACFRLHDESKSGAVDRRQFDEEYEVARRHFPDDRFNLLMHKLAVERTVWAYRMMKWVSQTPKRRNVETSKRAA